MRELTRQFVPIAANEKILCPTKTSQLSLHRIDVNLRIGINGSVVLSDSDFSEGRRILVVYDK